MQYTPRDLSFQANVPGRRKVFCYIIPQKKSIIVYADEVKYQLDTPEEFSDTMRASIRADYNKLKGIVEPEP